MVVPVTHELCLTSAYIRAEHNTETNRQLKKAHTLTTTEEQPPENPGAISAESTLGDQEPLKTCTACVYTPKPTSGFLVFLSGESNDIGTKEQTPPARSKMEVELITAIGFESKEVTYVSNIKHRLSLKKSSCLG